MSQKEPFKWRKVKESVTALVPKADPTASRQPPPRVTQATDIPQALTPPVVEPAGTETAPVPSPSHDQIAVRAYELWEAQGWPAGAQDEHWLEAERELRANADAK